MSDNKITDTHEGHEGHWIYNHLDSHRVFIPNEEVNFGDDFDGYGVFVQGDASHGGDEYLQEFYPEKNPYTVLQLLDMLSDNTNMVLVGREHLSKALGFRVDKHLEALVSKGFITMKGCKAGTFVVITQRGAGVLDGAPLTEGEYLAAL